MANWSEKNIPDLTGKVIIITGANSGIGFENTKQFSKKGATVIMACRNMKRGQNALDKITQENPNANLVLMYLDLSSLESIKNFVGEFNKRFSHLDVLLNNAGILAVPYGKTVDGFERQMGTNHLGHFALTAQLYDLLKKTNGSRIINVSSGSHAFGKMDWDDFLFEKNYKRMAAYERSKLANLLFTYEMDRRFKSEGIEILSVASHPGGALTNLADHLFGRFKILKYPIVALMRIFMIQSAAKGALPSSRAAVDPDVKGGQYYGPKGIFGTEQRGPPGLVKSKENSHNLEDARKLWDISEELTRIKFVI